MHGTRLSTVCMHNNAKVDFTAEALSKPCSLMSFLNLVMLSTFPGSGRWLRGFQIRGGGALVLRVNLLASD